MLSQKIELFTAAQAELITRITESHTACGKVLIDQLIADIDLGWGTSAVADSSGV